MSDADDTQPERVLQAKILNQFVQLKSLFSVGRPRGALISPVHAPGDLGYRVRAMSRTLDLRQRLELHQPFDAEEASHRDRMLALCEVPGDVFSRGHFQPGHFTASAFVLSPDRSALLLILHGKLRRWLQPGGHVDAEDADILAAARREVQEEVGLLDLPLAQASLFDLDVHDIPSLKGDPSHAHFDVRFLFQAPDLGFRAGSDAKAARWVPVSEINQEISDRSVMRAVDKLRGARDGA
jgi:ADP-ribose pyrophosphatase YjhB (NUDIX family)